jgi:hypothetical protein
LGRPTLPRRCGPTTIAFDKSGGRARLMELDPKYVDAIILRFQDFSGE